MFKKFICLGNSYRQGGACIAGKEISDSNQLGAWFRPVGREHASLSRTSYDFAIGGIYSCDVDTYSPLPTQCENYTLSADPQWKRYPAFPRHFLDKLVDMPHDLWYSSNASSSRFGLNDRISMDDPALNGQSLYFVRLPVAELYCVEEGYEFSRPRLRMAFAYAGVPYKLRVTDFSLCSRTMQVGDCVKLGPCYVTVSLGCPYKVDNNCYKLVAGYVAL